MDTISGLTPVQPHVLRRRVRSDLPLLRRFARALTGNQRMADTAVLQLVADLLSPSSEQRRTSALRPALYHRLRRILCELGASPHGDGHLIGSTPLARQAQLLMRVEGFSLMEASAILEIDADEVSLMLKGLEEHAGSRTGAQILIIEDEPLIGLQLEAIVGELGHVVIGVAPTRRQAVQLVKDRAVDLILSDVQLADNSSGIDAVTEI